MGGDAVALLDQGQSLRESLARPARLRPQRMTSWPDGRRQPGGALAQALITACVTGIVTSVTMVGPLLLDISRDLGISVAQAGLLAAAAAVPQALGSPFGRSPIGSAAAR